MTDIGSGEGKGGRKRKTPPRELAAGRSGSRRGRSSPGRRHPGWSPHSYLRDQAQEQCPDQVQAVH